MRRSEIEAAEEALEQRIAEKERHLMALVAETRVRVRRGWRMGLAASGGIALVVGLLGAWRVGRRWSRAA